MVTGSVIARDDEYIAILYGDANGDGIVCDTDDIMVIINDFLGIQESIGTNKIAANLDNSDNVLDIDDIVIMMNMYLGNLMSPLVTNLPNSNITIEQEPILNDINVIVTVNASDLDSFQFPENWRNQNALYFEQTPIARGTIKFTTNTTYDIEFMGIEYGTQDWYFFSYPWEQYFQDWNTFENDINITQKFYSNIGYRLSTTGSGDIIKYRLHDVENNRYSEEKSFTLLELFEQIENQKI